VGLKPSKPPTSQNRFETQWGSKGFVKWAEELASKLGLVYIGLSGLWYGRIRFEIDASTLGISGSYTKLKKHWCLPENE